MLRGGEAAGGYWIWYFFRIVIFLWHILYLILENLKESIHPPVQFFGGFFFWGVGGGVS